MSLGSTQPLTEMSTKNISWGVKAAGALGRQPYHLHVQIVLKSGSLNFLEPPGPFQACLEIALPLPIYRNTYRPPNLLTYLRTYLSIYLTDLPT